MSVNRRIKTAAIAMLEDDLALLETDDSRTPIVVEYLGENTFSQRHMPMIAVPRVERVREEAWDRQADRRDYELTLLLVDSTRANAQDDEEVETRLDLMGEQIRGIFGLEKNMSLRMPDLDCFYSMCSWTEGESLTVGNNLRLRGYILTIPLTVDRTAAVTGE